MIKSIEKIHQKYLDAALNIRLQYLGSLKLVEKNQESLRKIKNDFEGVYADVLDQDFTKIGKERGTEYIHKVLGDLEILAKKLEKEIKPIEDEIKRLKNEASKLYDLLKSKYPKMSEEAIKSQIKEYVEKKVSLQTPGDMDI